jgi:hypothetical protein
LDTSTAEGKGKSKMQDGIKCCSRGESKVRTRENINKKEDFTVDQEKNELPADESVGQIELNEKTFETLRNAALAGKAAFPDQIDYYDPEQDEII